MTKPFVLATITPSGNRVVETVVQSLIRDLPGASAHFTRIPVVGDTGGVTGYDMARMIGAATLLSHARPGVISWNGTKGGALGFDVDHALCAEITAATGLPTSTSALAILAALEKLAARRIALVTPYDDAYQAKCIAAFAGKGFEIVAERHAGLIDNFSYGLIPTAEIVAMTRAALRDARADAVIYFCTNFDGADAALEIEREFDLPVLDSTVLGVWGALKAAAWDISGLGHRGRIFSL